MAVITVELPLAAEVVGAVKKKVTLLSFNGRRWEFPFAPPEFDSKFPLWEVVEVDRPTSSPATVLAGKTLHVIDMTFTLAYQDGRSVEPDLQQLRGFAGDGHKFQMSYGPSEGGWWRMSAAPKVTSKQRLPGGSIQEALVTLQLKRDNDLSLNITPIKASSSTDVPAVVKVKVAVSGGNSDARASLPGMELPSQAANNILNNGALP